MNALVLLTIALAAPVPKGLTPGVIAPNTNIVMIAHAATMSFDSSSEYQGYPLRRLFDPADKQPWYFAAGDCPQNGKKPWARVSFATAATVNRVTVLGNRDPGFPQGYFALEGFIELLDADGKVLEKQDVKSSGEKNDFNWELEKPRGHVRAIRFTVIKDDGKCNCVGLSKVQVE